MSDCYECGDGVVQTESGGGWRHAEDLGIDVDGNPVVSTCGWGKPYPPKDVGGGGDAAALLRRVGQVASRPEADPVVLLTEIAQTAMDRMNTAVDMGPWEAMTLGAITALAVRCPGVVEGLKDSPQ